MTKIRFCDKISGIWVKSFASNEDVKEDFRLRCLFRQWTAPKLLEIDQDNVHTKFSA